MSIKSQSFAHFHRSKELPSLPLYRQCNSVLLPLVRFRLICANRRNARLVSSRRASANKQPLQRCECYGCYGVLGVLRCCLRLEPWMSGVCSGGSERQQRHVCSRWAQDRASIWPAPRALSRIPPTTYVHPIMAGTSDSRMLPCHHGKSFPSALSAVLQTAVRVTVARKAMHEAAATPPLRHEFSDRLITLHVVGGFVRGKTSAGAPSKPS
jgi:hypothetical protein